MRTYAGNTVTISGANISKVVFTFGASDGSNAILADSGELAENVWTGSATEVVFTIDGTSGNRRIAKMEVTYGEGTPVETSEDPVVLKDIVAEASVKAVSVKVGESSEKVEVTVTDPAEGATVVLASKDETIATIAEGIVTGVAVGETEITATITAEGYNEKVISIPVTVAAADESQDPQPAQTGSGTLEDPYTVDGAVAYIDGEQYDSSAKVYVAGKISKIDEEFGSQFGNGTFWISSDGTENGTQFEAYRVKFLNNQSWTEENTQIQLGDEVVLYGAITKYNTTYETSSNKAYLYSLNGITGEVVTAKLGVSDISGIPAEGVLNAEKEITITNGYGWEASVVPDGTVVTAATIEKNVITYSVSANSGDARDGSIIVTLKASGKEDVAATIKVSQVAAGTVITSVTDVLNAALTGVTGTSYVEWSGKSSNSSAVYAGQSAAGNNAIQLRSNNNNSGVITTATGGKVKKIVVTWNSNTASGRTISVYGKNTAYAAATELYDADKQGDLLGEIVMGTTTELEIAGDYEFIGFRSKSGALYLDEVQIDWDL